jgi:antitoxin component HigA of HigAB toxin-antitoxin module
MNIKPILNDDDYKNALIEVEELMDAQLGTPRGQRLEILMALIETYEGSQDRYRTAMNELCRALRAALNWRLSTRDRDWAREILERYTS